MAPLLFMPAQQRPGLFPARAVPQPALRRISASQASRRRGLGARASSLPFQGRPDRDSDGPGTSTITQALVGLGLAASVVSGGATLRLGATWADQKKTGMSCCAGLRPADCWPRCAQHVAYAPTHTLIMTASQPLLLLAQALPSAAAAAGKAAPTTTGLDPAARLPSCPALPTYRQAQTVQLSPSSVGA